MDTSINTPPDVNSTPPAVAPLRSRWHWTTRLLALLMLILFAIINLGGDQNPITERTDYGWPWVYREYKPQFYTMMTLVPPDREQTWYHFWPLVGNVFVGGVLIATSGYFWERRVRRLKGWLRFTIRDWFWLCGFMAIGYSWFANLYHDNRIVRDLVQREQGRGVTRIGWIEQLFFQQANDVPCDWFWNKLSIPDELRPLRIYSLSYEPYSNDEMKLIAQLQSLRILEISQPRNITRAGWHELQRLKPLESFQLEYYPEGEYKHQEDFDAAVQSLAPMDANCLTFLQQLPNLRTLKLSIPHFDEEWLMLLKQLPAIEELQIFHHGAGRGTTVYLEPAHTMLPEAEAQLRKLFSQPSPSGEGP